jgi:hypothetical protein
MLSVMLNVFILSVVLLSIDILSVIMLNDFRLSVVAPSFTLACLGSSIFSDKHHDDCITF